MSSFRFRHVYCLVKHEYVRIIIWGISMPPLRLRRGYVLAMFRLKHTYEYFVFGTCICLSYYYVCVLVET